MKTLENILNTESGRRQLALKITKDPRANKLFQEISGMVKAGKLDRLDLITCGMRYAANGMYDNKYPGAYRKWAKIWYREWYLQCPHWIEFRNSILKKHNGKCELCKRSGLKLDIHHRSYDNIFMEKRKDVIVICRNCHSKIHPDEP